MCQWKDMADVPRDYTEIIGQYPFYIEFIKWDRRKNYGNGGWIDRNGNGISEPLGWLPAPSLPEKDD